MYDIECITPPTQTGLDVVPLIDMKKHVVNEDDFDDDLLTKAINDAVAYFDGQRGVLNRTIMPRTWRLYLRAFPCSIIELPYAPLLEVQSVAYLDSNGQTQTVDPAAYVVKAGKEPAEIEVLSVWPSTAKHPRAVTITYSAGFELYPDNLQRAVKFMAAHYYANREATVAGLANETRKLEFGLDHLLSGLTVPHAFGSAQP